MELVLAAYQNGALLNAIAASGSGPAGKSMNGLLMLQRTERGHDRRPNRFSSGALNSEGKSAGPGSVPGRRNLLPRH